LGILDYNNIGIVLTSQEQGDPTGVYPQIADTVYISAHYVPSSSPVKMELNRTLLNTSTGADLNITFNSFDRNYYNLKAFRVQYMKQGDADWTTLKEYLVNVEEGQQLSSMQAVLPEAADVTFTYDMSSEADGKYTFRVLSASTYGTGESTLVTDAIEVIKDMSRPMVFGTPKPTTGFLGMGDDIEITFNGTSLGQTRIQPLEPYAATTLILHVITSTKLEKGTYEVIFRHAGKEIERNTFVQ
jgi:hypothetical protein